ncbi:hypothetical protein OJ997_04645 [Solirubrobacter phytolaccae]|uniref:LVIVD repeat-containing protein n=1 Tax=Solirubrobacter phytolaccae TaxID=1404360 RepID=A0A9X3N764_9ACTN|nr:hypothetical protein [Solirubrobacter phytolaccae]MDA0179574.1 hypothetical protein [Solirubrobacter phytolaccae]
MSGLGARVRLALVAGAVVCSGALAASASAQLPSTTDPRVGLSAGFDNAGVAKRGIELLANRPKPAGWGTPGEVAFFNSDMAFQGNYAFVGGWNGFQIFDISNPSAPVLKTAAVCPGGQGDLSVYGNLLFVSVEETRARKDCKLASEENGPTTSANRFRGVRIFDISDINNPQNKGGVQTCRGSHTHTLVEGKGDPSSVYIYVSGTSGTVGQTDDIATCDAGPATNANPSQWRIEVIKVPLANPTAAAIVNEPRVFKNEQTGALNGLQNLPQTQNHPCTATSPNAPGGGCQTGATGPTGNWQPVPDTNSCHDITVFESQDIAAGACEGNGLLLDISDPANPRRIDAVADPLFAYWHGATFSNDGRYVVFTDEWGGGTNPRCRATDQLSWGGNAIYEIVNRKLVFRSYYKMPAAQTVTENCVSHIPSIVPVEGRHVFVQAWYQAGASMVDFTNAAAPKEIGYYDRGPISATTLVFGGWWSTYWYNGTIYASELSRGFDSLALTPTTDLTAADLATTKNVLQSQRLNVQTQQPYLRTSTSEDGNVGGTVPATLGLSLGTPANFGTFTPGVPRTYEASTKATVISTAGDALLSVSDAGPNPGFLVNGAFKLTEPLQARARNATNTGTAYNNVGSVLNLLQYSAPISNDEVQLQFSQKINANDALRTGTYSKTLTFTLSTTNP